MPEPVRKRRIVAGELDAHQRARPALAPWELAWSTESPVEATRAVEHLDEHGIATQVETAIKRHAAMNTVEYRKISVPSPDVARATALLAERPDLFPGSASFSEPLRYSRGMWGRVSSAGLGAKIGYVVFVGFCALIALLIVSAVLLSVFAGT